MSKMTYENGYKIWRNDVGQWHREDGPAYIGDDGTLGWCVDGVFHRLDGPSIINADGRYAFRINDVDITLKVDAWVIENSFPHWSEWTDSHKMMFRLTFSGNNS